MCTWSCRSVGPANCHFLPAVKESKAVEAVKVAGDPLVKQDKVWIVVATTCTGLWSRKPT